MNPTDEYDYGPRRIKLYVPHEPGGVYEGEPGVEILNIEEDIQGADVVTFRCPICHGEHKSRRYG